MKKILIIGGLIVGAFWIGYDQKNSEAETFIRKKTMAECQETWSSKGGKYIWKHGPIGSDFEPRDREDQDFETNVRNCYADWDKKMTVADEYTKNWINSPCHSGFRYMPDMSSLESTKPARCYPYKKPISRIVKTWSWKTK